MALPPGGAPDETLAGDVGVELLLGDEFGLPELADRVPGAWQVLVAEAEDCAPALLPPEFIITSATTPPITTTPTTTIKPVWLSSFAGARRRQTALAGGIRCAADRKGPAGRNRRSGELLGATRTAVRAAAEAAVLPAVGVVGRRLAVRPVSVPRAGGYPARGTYGPGCGGG